MKRFINTSGEDLSIFSDGKLTTVSGMLGQGSAYYCVPEWSARVVLLYKASLSKVCKIGFTDYVQGVREAKH